jgi:CubicO group peptidase (beta-lactamase class C family)
MIGYVTRRLAMCMASAWVAGALLVPANAQPAAVSAPTDDATLDRFAAVRQQLTASYKSVRAVVVARADLPIFEHYRVRIDPNEPVDVHSITKSITSILVGIAFGQGKLRSLDQPISDFLPEVNAPGVDPRARDITIRHLLTMTSGFDTAAGNKLGNAPTLSDLWVWSLYRPMLAAPGERFSYDNESPHLLSRVLARATKRIPGDYARENLFEPLGIEKAIWLADGEGNALGGYGLSMNVHDMVKIGSLYLRDGRWQGKQVVPEWYVRDSIRPHQRADETDYGYMWWVPKPLRAPGPYFAAGYGGQLVFIVPLLDAVIAIQSDSNGSFSDALSVARSILAVLRSVGP